MQLTTLRARKTSALVAAAALACAVASPATAAADGDGPRRTLDILEFRVRGVTRLPQAELELALTPFLGPARTLEDVERARVALERAYSERGWLAVTVAIPPQTVREGVVTLDVTEGKVGRMRVMGARWFLPSEIRRKAPSMAEGEVPNFNDIVADIFELNQLPDRRVTPSLRAGSVPGTIAVDLDVQDNLPLHGTAEVNNRASPGTTPTRVNGSLRYDNLWQLGHSLALSFQTAPERTQDGRVFAGTYVSRFPDVTWLTLTATAIVQDSDVSTIGGTTVLGKGQIYGLRTTFTMAASSSAFQTVGLGVDYKQFEENIALGSSRIQSPVTYWPFSVQYGGTWQGGQSSTSVTALSTFGIRGLGSSAEEFDTKRYKASANFFSLKVDAARSDPLPGLLELHERVVGQFASGPLVGPEQIAVGGADTVRGYLEAQAIGDEGFLGQVELRGPSVSRWFGGSFIDDLRLLGFVDAGRAVVLQPLPDQQSAFTLWSFGAGMRFKVIGHFASTLDVAFPMSAPAGAARLSPRLHFRIWSEF